MWVVAGADYGTPVAPSGLSAVGGDTEVTLSWTPTTLGTTEYIDVIPYAPFSDSPDGIKSWITISESSSSISTCDIQLFDVNNAIIPWNQNPQPIQIVDNTSGRNLFWGLVQTVTADPIATYLVWKIHAVDWNWCLPLALVGTPYDFAAGFAPTDIAYVDPNAQITGGSDADAVVHLFHSYWLFPGITPDTSTYVETINPTIAVYPNVINWDRGDMQQSLNDVCAASGPYTQCWIDMDGYVHLTAFAPQPGQQNVSGQPLTLGFPVYQGNAYIAPYELVEDDPDHVTTYNYENFTVEWDMTGFGNAIYVRGGTDMSWTPVAMDFTVPPTYEPEDINPGGTGFLGGGGGQTGWAGRYLDAPNAITGVQRDAAILAALPSMFFPVVRGTSDVIGESVAFHAGQMLTITNTPTGLGTVTYPIQKVTTTLLSGTDERRCALEWGTAQFGSLGVRQSKAKVPTPSKGAVQFLVSADAYSAHTGQAINLTAQMINAAGNSWAIAGVQVAWTCKVVDDTGTDVTATTSFTLTPGNTATNGNGQVAAGLTLDASATGVQYQVTCTNT